MVPGTDSLAPDSRAQAHRPQVPGTGLRILQSLAVARTSEALTDADRCRVTRWLKALHTETKAGLGFADLADDGVAPSDRLRLPGTAETAWAARVSSLEELMGGLSWSVAYPPNPPS